MTKQDILDYFSLINFAYNESGRLESLSRMLDELLKEQEAVEPTIDEHGNKRCGSCGYKLQSVADPDLFCCKCGKQVKWE